MEATTGSVENERVSIEAVLGNEEQWDTQKEPCRSWVKRWNERISEELGCNIADYLEKIVKEMYANGWTADDSVATLGRIFRLLDSLAKRKLRQTVPCSIGGSHELSQR